MSTHTPGPWVVAPGSKGDPDLDDCDFMVEEATGRQEVVATIVGPIGTGSTDANARLIAAAPELLDALRAFCGDYESTPTTSDTSLKAAYLHALKVIAKAEGR